MLHKNVLNYIKIAKQAKKILFLCTWGTALCNILLIVQ